MRRVPTAPTDVITHAVLGDPLERIVEKIDPALAILMNVLLADLAEQPIVFVREECIIELDQESGVEIARYSSLSASARAVATASSLG